MTGETPVATSKSFRTTRLHQLSQTKGNPCYVALQKVNQLLQRFTIKPKHSSETGVYDWQVQVFLIAPDWALLWRFAKQEVLTCRKATASIHFFLSFHF